jgi:hypothetical protein
MQARIDFRKGTTFNWNVLSGTGDYEDLHAAGSGVGLSGVPCGDPDACVLDIYDGGLHIDRSAAGSVLGREGHGGCPQKGDPCFGGGLPRLRVTIQSLGTEATGNLVQGNYIGTDSSGTAGLGNFDDGVVILNGPGNTIGGTTAGARKGIYETSYVLVSLH